jgi:hypothetical protein
MRWEPQHDAIMLPPSHAAAHAGHMAAHAATLTANTAAPAAILPHPHHHRTHLIAQLRQRGAASKGLNRGVARHPKLHHVVQAEVEEAPQHKVVRPLLLVRAQREQAAVLAPAVPLKLHLAARLKGPHVGVVAVELHGVSLQQEAREEGSHGGGNTYMGRRGKWPAWRSA